jgi:hypothetical protein
VFFKIIGRIWDVQTIASGKGIRERRRLRKLYGGQRWKKLKGTATIKLADGTICHACIGMKRTVLAHESSRLSAFSEFNETNGFAIRRLR